MQGVKVLKVHEFKYLESSIQQAVQKARQGMAGLKMLKFCLGVTRMEKIRNECIRETAHVEWFGHKVREAKLT